MLSELLPGWPSLGAQGQAQFVYLVVLLLVVLTLATRLRAIGLVRVVAMLAAWVLIFVGAITIVSQRDRLREVYEQVVHDIDPAEPQVTGGEVRIRPRMDGHFWTQATVNGEKVLFLIDTGSSDVVLTADTARRIGVDLEALHFDRVAVTANGPVRGASIRLDTLMVGSIIRTDVPAAVTEGALEINLLGMRFLNSLESWRVERGTLILQS